MAEIHREIASHTVREGMFAVRLHGGPWDGRVVGVDDPQARLVAVHGPRHGNHRVWITHVYERHGPFPYTGALETVTYAPGPPVARAAPSPAAREQAVRRFD